MPGKLIMRVLNTIYYKMTKKNYDFLFYQQSLSTTLGEVFLESFMQNIYLYKSINNFTENDSIKDKNIFKSFYT